MKRKSYNNSGTRVSLMLLALSMLTWTAQAQTGYGSLNGNGISTRFSADGIMFWDGQNAWFEAPKGSGKNSISAAALWIGGLDKQGDLHMSAQTYRESGSDFWPGPLNTATGAIDANTSEAYNKVWHVSRLEIDSFLAGLSVPKAILDWPGNGDVSQGQPAQLAPYIDKDHNGKYEPLKGDYPDIKGDEMVWWVSNDMLRQHTESRGLPMGIEVHGSAWTYNCGGDPAVSRSVFVHYDIINRSANDYDSVYAGLWTDFDIGNLFDDYVGSIPSMNTYYGYNGDNFDNDTIIKSKSGTFTYKGYGKMLPAQALTYLEGIKDGNGQEMRMSRFIYYNNDQSVMGNPVLPTQYYRYLLGQWLDGSPLTVGGVGRGGSQLTRYAFSGLPGDANAWSEMSAQNTPGDRRALGAYGPFSLKAGDTRSFTAVYSFYQAANGKTLQSIANMQQGVQNITSLYRRNALKPCSGLSFCSGGDSCVWPGDANHDGVAQMRDIFNIGYAYGSTGPARPFASNNWVAQSGANWGMKTPDGIDYHHADANGDGVVDSFDVIPLVMNCTQTHNKKDELTSKPGASPLLQLNIDEDTVVAGGTIHGEVLLGTDALPADSVYGVSFRIKFDTALVVPGTLAMNLGGSSMGDLSKVLMGYREGNGYVDVGIARTDKKAKNIKNIIVKWKYVVEGNVGGFHTSSSNAQFKMDLINVIDANFNIISVDTLGDRITVLNVPDAVYTPEAIDAMVKMYPNPSSSYITIDAARMHIGQVRIINLQGQVIQSVTTQENNLKLDVSNLPDGIYMVEINTGQGRTVKKFVKTR